jgi:uncharacterized protein YndB with AHSA1/START domain
MSIVETSIDIDAPIDRVFEFIKDPNRLEDWVTIHRKLGPVKGEDEGSTIEQTLCLRGAHFKVRWTLTELEAPHRLKYEGKGPARSLALIEDRLSENGSGGTHFEYRNEFKPPLGPLGGVANRVLVGGLSQREAEKSLRRLKEILERSSNGAG